MDKRKEYEGMPYQPGNTIQMAIHPKEEARAREIFAALEDGGQVIMPLQKTDWSPLYGNVRLFQLLVRI